MNIVPIIVGAIVVALLLYALYLVLRLFPLTNEIRTIIWVIVIVILAVWLASNFTELLRAAGAGLI